MRIPRHWAKAICTGTYADSKTEPFWTWGWSFESLAEAKEAAATRAQRLLAHLANGTQPDSYDYLEHPPREEIVQTIEHDGQTIAMITRNRYGALVLNCAAACFVDIDFPRVKATGLVDALLLLLLAGRKAARVQAERTATIERVQTWLHNRHRRPFRLYETAAGLRLLLTDRLYDPTSSEITRLLGELGADPMYVKLTTRQECFRARLTAKPWRCGCERPPNRYPWDDAAAERKYRSWQEKYEQRASRYGTCRLLKSSDSISTDEAIATIIRIHDQHACCETEMKLA